MAKTPEHGPWSYRPPEEAARMVFLNRVVDVMVGFIGVAASTGAEFIHSEKPAVVLPVNLLSVVSSIGGVVLVCRGLWPFLKEDKK